MPSRSWRRTTAGVAIGVLAATLGPAGPSSAYYDRPYSTQRVDRSTSEADAGDGIASSSSISADGRFVAFDHSADNLAAGDANQQVDVFVRDLRSGETQLVSRNQLGLAGTGAGIGILAPPGSGGSTTDIGFLSFDPSISANGRFIAFSSYATDLVVGDTNLAADIFVFDRVKKTTERVSVDSQGGQTDGAIGSYLPSISANGRFVSFTSGADNLVSDDGNNYLDVFVHDRQRHRTTRVSTRSDGGESSGVPCAIPVPHEALQGLKEEACRILFPEAWPTSSISGDGRNVVFDSLAADIVNNDLNGIWDVFVHDRAKGRTRLVSADVTGDPAQLHVLARPSSNCTRMGSSLTAPMAFAVSNLPAARASSADGRFIVFASNAANLVPSDTTHPRDTSGAVCTGGTDVFVRDLKNGRTQRVSVESDGREINVNEPITTAFGAGGYSVTPSISADGRAVVFNAFCVGCHDNSSYYQHPDTGRYRGTMATVHLASGSVWTAHAVPRDESDRSFSFFQEHPDISATGRYVSFRSNLLGNDRRIGGAGSVLRQQRTFVRWDWGTPVGLVATDVTAPARDPQDDRICINEICVPPGGRVSQTGRYREGLLVPSGDLIGASVAYRPEHGDLLVAAELAHLQEGDPAVLVGLRLAVRGRELEIRASGMGGGSFGLFDCTDSALRCTKVSDLQGGFGTTGQRVVFSLPLEELGSEGELKLSKVRAFTASGTLSTGPVRIMDVIHLGA